MAGAWRKHKKVDVASAARYHEHSYRTSTVRQLFQGDLLVCRNMDTVRVVPCTGHAGSMFNPWLNWASARLRTLRTSTMGRASTGPPRGFHTTHGRSAVRAPTSSLVTRHDSRLTTRLDIMNTRTTTKPGTVSMFGVGEIDSNTFTASFWTFESA
eukprot:scaffold122604_cov36-Prasinocladus_malaysianus.AAC.1